ncbi:MAG TPA: hypothetical protein VHB79_16180 [Polyangiaceae bacterium]|nr:hypothetical protein [Polyangiaceae bacterium]
MKASLFLVVGVALSASVLSCAGGTETDNPATLKDFSASDCKTRQTDAGQQALVLSSDAEGLQCIEWHADAQGGLELELLNFPEPCGNAYLGAATQEGGSVLLSVHKDSCEVFRCGTCVFDFQFKLQGIDTAHDLPLRIGSAICESEPIDYSDDFRLPLAKRSSGTVCRYLGRSAVEQYGRERTTCGSKNLPCGDCNGTDATSCGTGLSCMEVASSDTRCLATCGSDDDCADGLTSCRDGVCQSSFDW